MFPTIVVNDAGCRIEDIKRVILNNPHRYLRVPDNDEVRNFQVYFLCHDFSHSISTGSLGYFIKLPERPVLGRNCRLYGFS